MSASGLVGRERERAVLLEALDDVRRGRARCVALVGEAGIGKTSLIDEFVTDLQGSPETVLRGRAAEFELQVPFALVIDALDHHIRGLDEDLFARLGEDRLAELAAVFPSLAGRSHTPVGTEVERYRCHYAVRALLEEIASDWPVVLAIDDVHWSDEGSVELLAHLLRRRPERPVLLLLAYRPHGARPLLVKSVEAAAREGRLDMLRLPPLTAEQAGELLGADVDASTRQLLFEDSGGNPFYLQQLARAPLRESTRRAVLLGDPDDDGQLEVPSAVRASLAQELDRVSDAARSFLQAAAIVGEPFEPDLAATVAELDETGALAALDELIESGLVHATDTPRRFTFRHPIVCRAVYESVGQGWRLAAHRRAAEALSSRGEPTLMIAPHVERSARTGDDAAIELLTQAGRAAQERTPRTAARCYRAALRLVPADTGPSERRLGLLVAVATALASTGRLNESRVALSEALRLLAPDESDRRVEIVTLLAQTDAFLGRLGEGHAQLADTLERIAPDRFRDRAALMLDLAVDQLRAGKRDDAAKWSGDALAMALRAGDGPAHGAAAALLGLSEHARGSIATARESAESAAKIIDGLQNRDLASRLVALFHLSCAELALGEFDAAIRHSERGLAVARATGQARLVVPLTFSLGWSQLWLGRLDEARQSADAMVEASHLLGIDLCSLWAWTLSGAVAVQRGDIALAVEAAEHAVECALAAPLAMFGHLSHCVLAEAYLAAGQPERARQELLAHAGGADLRRVEVGSRARWYEVLADAELALERPDAARDWVRRAEQAAGFADLPAQRGAAQRARATLLLLEDRADAAAKHALDAVEAFAAHGLRVEAARSLTVVGRSLAAAGNASRAVETLESAYRELDSCGAERGRDEAARELRRLAHKVPRRVQRGQAGGEGARTLSGRQREVADLIAQGRTNREIGAALYVSERTVENHVSQIFRKLRVASRAEIAREIGRTEEAGAPQG